MILKPFSKLYARMKIKRSLEKDLLVNDFSTFTIEDIKSVLILTPNSNFKIEEITEAADLVSDQLGSDNIDILNTSTFPDKTINIFGYPNKLFFKSYENKRYDLVLDLSGQYSLLNTFILSFIQPALRIKSYHDNRNDKYFHFIFSSHKKSYVDIARHYLSMVQHVLTKKILKNSSP